MWHKYMYTNQINNTDGKYILYEAPEPNLYINCATFCPSIIINSIVLNIV